MTPRTRYEAYGQWSRLHDLDLERQERNWRRVTVVLAAVTFVLLLAHAWRLS